MAAGCLVLSDESAFLKENFNPGEDLVFYNPDQPENLKEKIKSYLSHEEEAADIVKSGQTRVIAGHTWNHRTELILRTVKMFSN
ncbi:glycosyltransferase [candidate division KSB1 bacterium]